MFKSLATATDRSDWTYISTDVPTDNELGRRMVEQVVQGAKDRSSLFIPVVLSCDASVNAQRMRSEERSKLVAGGSSTLLQTLK